MPRVKNIDGYTLGIVSKTDESFLMNDKDQVPLPHNCQYKISLYSPEEADAEVTIDNKHVGTWRVEPNRSYKIERGVSDQGIFTYYASGTSEANVTGLNQIEPEFLGLVQVLNTRRLFKKNLQAARCHCRTKFVAVSQKVEELD